MAHTRIYKPRLVWNEGDINVAIALGAEINRWAGTPYESGQSFPQRGADCTGSIFGIVDALDGRARMQPAGFPNDGSLHDRAGAVRSVREIVNRYSPCRKLESDDDGYFQVEPGDIVVTGMPGGGPGHVEIVGANKNELWHAQPAPGFHQGGWSFLEQQILYAIYRIEDKNRWRHQCER
jgi:hypothetical protein